MDAGQLRVIGTVVTTYLDGVILIRAARDPGLHRMGKSKRVAFLPQYSCP
jgi:hypothetical protein